MFRAQGEELAAKDQVTALDMQGLSRSPRHLTSRRSLKCPIRPSCKAITVRRSSPQSTCSRRAMVHVLCWSTFAWHTGSGTSVSTRRRHSSPRSAWRSERVFRARRGEDFATHRLRTPAERGWPGRASQVPFPSDAVGGLASCHRTRPQRRARRAAADARLVSHLALAICGVRTRAPAAPHDRFAPTVPSGKCRSGGRGLLLCAPLLLFFILSAPTTCSGATRTRSLLCVGCCGWCVG